MIVEAREMGAATRVTHLRHECVRCKIRSFSPDVVHAALMTRVRYLLRNIAQQCAKRRRSTATEIWPPSNVILIEIRNRIPAQTERVFLDEFSRAEESPFFGIPRREYDRTLWSPPGFHLLGDGSRGLEHADGAADVVGCSRSPRIAMATYQNDLIGKLRSSNRSECVPDLFVWICGGVSRHRDSSLHWSGADVVPEGKAALPRLRNRLSTQSAKQFGRIPVRDGQYRNVRDIHFGD